MLPHATFFSVSVDFSNKLDREGREDISGRSPKKGTHGKGVAQTLARSFLPAKAGGGIETVRIIEALLVLSMTTFHLSVVPGRIGADELVANSRLSGFPFASSAIDFPRFVHILVSASAPIAPRSPAWDSAGAYQR